MTSNVSKRYIYIPFFIELIYGNVIASMVNISKSKSNILKYLRLKKLHADTYNTINILKNIKTIY